MSYIIPIVICVLRPSPPTLLQIQQFTQFPVVASSYSNRVTQSVEDISCKLWVPCGAADEAGDVPAVGAAAVAVATDQEVVPSAMALETLFED